MAEEEKNNQQETEDQGQPQAEAEEQQAEEAPAEAPDEEAPAEEQPSEEAGDEPEGGDEAAEEAPAAEGAGGEELEGLDWKARRRLERSRRPSEPQPERSPGELAEARRERRRAAGAGRRAYRKRARQRRRGTGQGTPPSERTSVAAKVRQGRVISSKADKTIKVRIDIARRHPAYEKIVRRSNTLHAHDERNEASEGDLVRLIETRPISRSKRWRLAEILEKAK